jgi:hypothetical protein
VAICSNAGRTFWLYRCDEDWIPFEDDPFDTLEAAKQQAEFEYPEVAEKWQDFAQRSP